MRRCYVLEGFQLDDCCGNCPLVDFGWKFFGEIMEEDPFYYRDFGLENTEKPKKEQ